MKIVNIMNFIRRGTEKGPDLQKVMLETTKSEFELIKSYGYESTFLIEYDALIAPEYIEFFKSNADEKTELGLWYEIVRPLTGRVGLEWRGDKNRDWDWHIIPGFSMAYSQKERELLADEAMNRFKEIYGYYPKTVASWLIDSYTVNYLSEKYHISAFAICRDQTNTDAYTLIGGYFNQAYYPSKRNMFTPAQTEELRGSTPVFRLLGPDPIHDYDKGKYHISPKFKNYKLPFTLEPIWDFGNDSQVIKYTFENYFKNESLSLAYCQLGQENGFGCNGGLVKIIDGLKRQFDEIQKYPDIKVMKMSDAGELFKKNFSDTPATSVCALSDRDGNNNIQSVYYDCKNYVANIFRFKNRIFIRSFYLFDEMIYDKYFNKACETRNNAIYENLPIVDTIDENANCEIILDFEADTFEAVKQTDSGLKVKWNDKSVIFSPDKIILENIKPVFDLNTNKAETYAGNNIIRYKYNGYLYGIKADNCNFKTEEGKLTLLSDGKITLSLLRNSDLNR